MTRHLRICFNFLIVLTVISTLLIATDAKTVSANSDKQAAASGMEINKGDPAPDFTLKNLLGDNVSLKDFRGHVLVLAFGFSKKTAKDPEQYRSRISSNFENRKVKFLKLIHINKPLFLTENFILKKMKKESCRWPLVCRQCRKPVPSRYPT